MATRSVISIKLENDLYKTIYCHHDGYLTHNGAMLLDHFKTKQKVLELLELGDLSTLGPNINPDPTKDHSFEFDRRQDGVCVAYDRDRGESNSEAKELSLKEMFNESWIECFYIFTDKNEWKYYDHDKGKIYDLKEGVEREYKNLGIKRPKGFYGYWTPSTLADEKDKQKTSQDEM